MQLGLSYAIHVQILLKLGANPSYYDYKDCLPESKCNGTAIHAFYESKGLKFEVIDRYEGEYDQYGLRSGQGILYHKPEGYLSQESLLYRGGFKNGQYNGYGTLYYEKNYDNKTKNDIDMVYTYKYKIISPHINHELELFRIKSDDFLSHVSQFHLPCVRAYYDGNVYLLPSCISALLTLMNIEYKYVSGNTDILEIVNKYVIRGFGTWLNETEIKDLIKYSLHVPFWYNLYNNSNKKLIIDLNTGCLPLSHKLFHPRLINKDLNS
jgi:hypothetical protein